SSVAKPAGSSDATTVSNSSIGSPGDSQVRQRSRTGTGRTLPPCCRTRTCPPPGRPAGGTFGSRSVVGQLVLHRIDGVLDLVLDVLGEVLHLGAGLVGLALALEVLVVGQ